MFSSTGPQKRNQENILGGKMSNDELEKIEYILKAAEKIKKKDVMDDFDAGYRLAFIHILEELKGQGPPHLKVISEED